MQRQLRRRRRRRRRQTAAAADAAAAEKAAAETAAADKAAAVEKEAKATAVEEATINAPEAPPAESTPDPEGRDPANKWPRGDLDAQAKILQKRLGLPEPFENLTPMVGIRFEEFKKFGRIPRSDEARAAGVLVEFDPVTMSAIFMSHTWWERSIKYHGADQDPPFTAPYTAKDGEYDVGTPDLQTGADKDKKFAVMCRGVEKLVAKGFPKDPFLWVDWFSIDQTDDDIKVKGVRSIIHYTTMCDAMLIPTPDDNCRYAMIDGTISPAVIPVYGTRGW